MIEIKITADTAAEALHDLTELTRTFNAPAPVSAPKTGKKDKTPNTISTPTTAENEAPATPPEKVENAVPAENEAPAGTWEPGGGAAVEEPQRAPAPEKPKKLTLEAVRAAGVNAAKKHGKETVKGILDSLGEVGMTSMDPSNYEEFMRKLGELDA